MFYRSPSMEDPGEAAEEQVVSTIKVVELMDLPLSF